MTRTDTAPKEPEEPRPVLYVPVRSTGAAFALRLFKQRDGSRCAVAFTSAAALTALLGPAQRSIRLAEPALRALATPLGATALVVDPLLTAPPVTAPPTAEPPTTAAPAVRAPALDTSEFPALQHQW